MTEFVVPPSPTPSLAVRGTRARFPVHRIYCVGRNFEDHAKEMGIAVDRGQPVFFTKPPDAVVPGGGATPYPAGTRDLHHEVELVVALGAGRAGEIATHEALGLVYGYGVGLDLTRRDRQALARKSGLPWDVAKAFDRSAPVSELVPVTQAGHDFSRRIWLEVDGKLRQEASLDDMIFGVAEIVVALSKLFELAAGDLIFMGTPAGVASLHPGDRYRAGIDGLATLEGEILADR
jgi:fumarylpyruvate hydrolase